MSDGALILLIFGAGLVGFATERIRHDLVALLMLAASVLLGLVPAAEAFAGFGDPAVITVAAVMVLSAAVSRSGMLERLLRPLQPLLSREAGIGIVYALLTGAASSVMNNVGALALLLPAALGSCRAAHVSPSRVLMPMAFASLLGGLVTMIGTPPNILLAQMRADLGGTAFAMFDFARVGLPLAVVGIAMTLLLVRLLPVRAERDEQPLKFRIADYLFELRVPDGVSPDLTVERLAATMQGTDQLEVHAIDRGGLLVTAPRASRRLLPGDIVQVEGRAAVVEQALNRWGLQIVSEAEDDLLAGAFAEFVVTDGSPLAGNPAASDMLAGQTAALVAVSRRGKAIAEALAAQAPQAGDVLLLQVAADRVPALAATMGLLPLADRPIRLGLAPRDLLPLLALLAAIAAAGAGLTSLGLALLLGVIVLALAGRLPADAYRDIDWPVILLLAALIPVATAFGQSSIAGELAAGLSNLGEGRPAWLLVGGVLAVTMAVTPFLNNAAAVLIMAPIAASAGQASGVPVDAMLMAVGVGASCDFLTPIGHQSNVLVWGPGGYQFGDYARIGAPISLMVLLLGTPLILWAWS
ncbi:SLC13 family permease [Sandarakinorhabdus sp. AAP62]|uniref:SLC13 family permease n=1 Tax=Sandarakinorhabdus sp. AAP62 TaxID=1248916 RepID=UPI0002D3C80C|nr:SLC13 family permease [Sandarakinorhabdus sp. AAP62]